MTTKNGDSVLRNEAGIRGMSGGVWWCRRLAHCRLMRNPVYVHARYSRISARSVVIDYMKNSAADREGMNVVQVAQP